MLPQRHLAASLGIGAGMWALTGNPLTLPAAVATGALIDGDHFPEYVAALVFGRRPRVVLLAHAWEWAALGLPLLVLLGGHPVALAAWLGLLSHLVLDQVGNREQVPPLFYFLTWRAWRRFRDCGPVMDQEEMVRDLSRVPLLGPLLLRAFQEARRRLGPRGQGAEAPVGAGRRAKSP